jgi:Family of unknown function (DUF5681)
VTIPPDDYKVGYGRPPLETRWRKGESGNPRKKPRRQETIVEMLDRLLLSPVNITLNGETKRVPSLEAIISQLQVKEMSGSASASRILLKYRAFASQHAEKEFQLIFVDGQSTPAVSDVISGGDRG